MARNKNPEITINRILDVAMVLFLEKGYDNTTIQDIVDALGDLSKGAIYHHFKSKEEIIEAVIPRLYGSSNSELIEIRTSTSYTGLEKLKEIVLISLKNPGQEKLAMAAPNLMKNPRFLTQQLYNTIEHIVPQLIEPIIKEGIKDGSIVSDNPKEVAETFMILMNIWINPAIFHSTEEEFKNKFMFFKKLVTDLGIPVLDDKVFEVLEKYRAIIENART
ncbi:TetR/AcrR family transcriptional regulator [Paraclostridium sordellii]|uniref:TetR/AcrR family transcriptional regulator n=1 Tax=Paraclostridium sordellii TaxID=1505 RepID=UPI0005E66854|nr:TetR/AcrR family transcriptional regulator [Paeniclostridium sordellii]CEO08116.1 TetR family transcriptional regulator [[Clostridium] sordellii] [Paeniclostridium sordellii]CEP87101.1 TetR family transcriptional regulator [[Clostridium] sordellii] [Paeniclostridium sordellii]CEP95438.1 TetR family transcriptional regulator [[Clostridium] sordellii] [Paeniclostridium sordellii]CEP99222.1 TetR family transcriptional regulator [[Clostridium] sordellii] [Paeniclostridium sordellii]